MSNHDEGARTEASSEHQSPPQSPDGRLEALRRYGVLGTEPEETFDRICRLAASIMETPMAAITFVADDYEWYKSAVGLPAGRHGLEESVCAHALHAAGPTVVEDATEDGRFADDPGVPDEPGIRSYAGVPLETPDGYRIGTLCVLDTEARSFADARLSELDDLARLVVDELELRRAQKQERRQRERLERKTTRVEETIESQDALLGSIAANVSDGIYRSTPEEGIVYANQAFVEMFGYESVADMAGTDPESLYANPDQRDQLLRETGGQDTAVAREVTFRRKDGSTFTGLLRARRITSGDGDTYFDGAVTDITERRRQKRRLQRAKKEVEQANQQLQRQQSRLRRTQEVAEVGGWEYDAATDSFEGNDRLYQLIGLPEDAALTREEALRFYPPEVRPGVEEAVDQCLREGKPFDLEVPFVRADGDRIWVRARGEPQSETEGGEPVTRIVGILQDITARKQRERALREAKARYQTLVENFPDGGVFLFDHDLRYTLAGGLGLAEAGFSQSAFEGATPRDVLPEAIADEQEHYYRRALDGERSVFEQSYGGRHYRIRTLPVRGGSGEVVAGMAVSHDITDQKKAERRLRESEATYRGIIDGARDSIYVLDLEGKFLAVNDSTARLLGLSKEALTGRPITDVLDADRTDVEDVRAALGAAADGEVRRVELWARRADGASFPKEVRLQPTEYFGEAAVLGVGRDITGRKQQRKQLRARQEKLEALYGAANRLLRATSREEVGELLIELVRNALGYRGVSVRFAREGRLEASHVATSTLAFMPERPDFDIDGESAVAAVYRSGETLAIDDLEAADVEDPNDYGDLRSVVVTPMGTHGTFAVSSPEPAAIAAFDTNLIEVLGTYATSVLDRLEKEERLQEAKETAEAARREAEAANRAKSTFLANMSHEIRTPLTSIIGFAEAIGDEINDLEQAGGRVGTLDRFSTLIEQSGRSLLETLDGVLNLSKLEAEEIDLDAKPVRLRTAAETVTEELRPQADESGVELLLETQGDIEARADEGGVQIILRNLLSNAIKYTGAGGRVWIRTRREGRAAVLEVEDTGAGMEPETVDHLFRPFRQGSEGEARAFEGTGLGLAVVQRATEQMGGRLDVETEKGEGTRIGVRLPHA